MICVRFYGRCLHPWDFLGGGLEMKNVDSNFSYKASCQESAGLLAIKMSSLYSAFKAFFWHNKEGNNSAKSINMYVMNVYVYEISSWINDRPKAKGNSEKVPFCLLSESTICTNVSTNIFKKFHSKYYPSTYKIQIQVSLYQSNVLVPNYLRNPKFESSKMGMYYSHNLKSDVLNLSVNPVVSTTGFTDKFNAPVFTRYP